MSVTDANPPHPTFVDDYVLHQVDNEWLEAAVKPKQFIIHLNTNLVILQTKDDGDQLSSIEVHDIVCHIADAVLAGGIRRAALISLFSVSLAYLACLYPNLLKIKNGLNF